MHARHSFFKTLVGTHVADIRGAGDDSWRGISLNQREEEIIHEYFSGRNNSGLWHLNQVIPPLFLPLGFEVKFTGIFCHGQPHVQGFDDKAYSGTRCPVESPCELGDLHLVFLFLDRRKRICNQRSILFQAKKYILPGGGPMIANKNQRNLYETAVSYEYVSMLKGKRDLPLNSGRNKALHYLFCGSLPATTSSACAPAVIDFGEMLFRFLIDSEGAFFNFGKGTNHNWSRINQDLLGAISRGLYKGTRRGAALRMLINQFNDFTDYGEFFADSGDVPGVPTMLVIVRDRELEISD